MTRKWTRVYTLPTKREAQKNASSLKRACKCPTMIKRIKADAYWRSRGQKWRWAVYRRESRWATHRMDNEAS